MKRVTSRIAVLLLTLGLFSYQTISAYGQKVDPASSPLACVRFFVDRINPEESLKRDGSFSYLAVRYWDLGRHEEAFRAASKMTCRELTMSASFLADRATREGNLNYALKFIDLGVGCIKDDDDAADKGRIFSDFTKLLIELHQDDRALEVAKLIEDDSSYKPDALARLAQSSIKARRHGQALTLLDRAFALARSVEDFDEHLQMGALGLIAEGYTQLQKLELAAAVLSFAQELAENNEGQSRDRCLSMLASTYANVGQAEKARRLVESIAPNNSSTLIRLASDYVKRGDKQRALALLSRATRDIESEIERNAPSNNYLTDIVHVYLQADEPQLASLVLGKINYAFDLRRSALAIADWWFTRGRNDMAILALDSAAQKIKVIKSEPPEELLMRASTSDGLEKARDLTAISDCYVKLKEYDRARQAIMAIDLPQWKAGKLAVLAGAMTTTRLRPAALNMLQEALTLSEKAEKRALDKERHETMTAIALGYARVGNREKSLALFARVLEQIREFGIDEGLVRLTPMAFHFEESGLRPDRRIKDVLGAIVREWSEDG